MTSENSDDGSAVVSDASSYKCDTVTPESVSSPKVVQSHPQNAAKPSPRKSPPMSAAFGSYLNKAIAQGSRAFYGADSEASDDDGGCDAELIGKAAHALSEDINDRIRLRVGPFSPTPSKGPSSPTASQSDPTADFAVIGDSATAMEAPVPDNVQLTPTAKVDQGCNSQPDCEERAAQTSTSGEPEVVMLRKCPDVAHTANHFEPSLPLPESSPTVKSDESRQPSADPDLLKQRAGQLEDRVRLLKERKSSARKPSFDVPGGSFVEQLKKLDLSLDGGTLKVCDRNLSENALATVVNAVKNNDKLTELDLSGCCIQKGDDLADLIRNAPSLQRLLLAWNCLGSARTGVAALASAVASATSLQEVDLRSNRIGPATAAALALALRTNNTLKRLGSPRFRSLHLITF